MDLVSRLLYRDGLVLVLDKPAGISVHAGVRKGENLEQYFYQLRFGLPRPPALAHRLDRDTSGCLVLGRHPKALRRLGVLFSTGKAEKTYWAVVEGVPAVAEGVVEAPLKKISSKKDGWRMVVAEDGLPSLTHWRLRASDGEKSWLELYPKTGRTHQIRAHCKHLGYPILGDPIYGKASSTPMQLHARRIILPLYPNKPPIDVVAEAPEHWLAVTA